MTVWEGDHKGKEQLFLTNCIKSITFNGGWLIVQSLSPLLSLWEALWQTDKYGAGEGAWSCIFESLGSKCDIFPPIWQHLPMSL